MKPVYFTHLASPLRKLLLVSDGVHLNGLYMEGQQYEARIEPSWERADNLPLFDLAKSQLNTYFSGEPQEFSVPTSLKGSEFQKQVWGALVTIPFGTTTTYGALAQALGEPGGARTIGHVIGQNPISIIIPCHRVVASTGALTGYNGGLERKQWLLDLESGRQRLGF